MGVKKLVITTEPKTFLFDLPNDAGINLNYEIYSIIKLNEYLAEYTIKNRVRQLLSKYKNKLSQRLDLRSSNKHAALQTPSVY